MAMCYILVLPRLMMRQAAQCTSCHLSCDPSHLSVCACGHVCRFTEQPPAYAPAPASLLSPRPPHFRMGPVLHTGQGEGDDEGPETEGEVSLRVWAPHATSVSLLLKVRRSAGPSLFAHLPGVCCALSMPCPSSGLSGHGCPCCCA